MSICSISTQWEKFLETFSKLTNMQENTETQKDWVLVYMLRMVFYKSGLLLFASSVCPLFLSPTHHKTLPKHFVHPPPKGARCSDITWRKCGTDVWTQGAVALLSAWHQHTIELSKLSCTYGSQVQGHQITFPRVMKWAPEGENIWKAECKNSPTLCMITNKHWLCLGGGRTVFGWEQELEVEPGPGVEPKLQRESLTNSIQGTHPHPP